MQYSDYKNADVKPNDIYRWRHPSQETDEKRNSGTSYWCCSRIAIAANNRLTDTYWAHTNDKGVYRIGSEHDKVLKVDAELELLGNLNDYEWRCDYTNAEHLSAMYRPEDILNLNHANSSRGNLFLRKGAEPCIEVQKADVKRRVDKAKRDIANAKDRLERLHWELAALNKGAQNQ